MKARRLVLDWLKRPWEEGQILWNVKVVWPSLIAEMSCAACQRLSTAGSDWLPG